MNEHVLEDDEVRLTLELPGDKRFSIVTSVHFEPNNNDRLDTMKHMCILLDDWAKEQTK